MATLSMHRRARDQRENLLMLAPKVHFETYWQGHYANMQIVPIPEDSIGRKCPESSA